MKLAYEAYDRAGRPVSDVIDAASPDDATEILRRRGLYVTRIDANATPRRTASHHQVDAAPPARHRRRRLGTTRKLKNLVMFTRQLYVLDSTGTPLVESLGALQRQTRDPLWKQVIADLKQRVEEGATLGEAMKHHPQCFDSIYRSLVNAGETSGQFDQMLDRLGHLARRQLHTRTTIIGALVYPTLLLGVSTVVLVALLTFVLPRFTQLFETLAVPLPPTTQLLVTCSDLLRQWWWMVLGGLVAVAALGRWWLTTPAGREQLDTLLVRTPYLGAITRSFITARIVRLLGTLLESHVSLLEALSLTRESAGNVHYRRLMTRAEDAVTRGDPISVAFNDEQLVSPAVYEALRSGEQTGQVGPLLLNIAEFLDEDNEVVVKSLTSILEPVILIGLGLLVGLVAISMFLPLFDLTASAGGY